MTHEHMENYHLKDSKTRLTNIWPKLCLWNYNAFLIRPFFQYWLRVVLL